MSDDSTPDADATVATPTTSSTATKGRGCLVAILVPALAFGLWIALRPEKSESEKQEDSSSLACGHFRDVARDYSQGVLTLDELRDKLGEVRDDSVIATPRVQAAATAMMARITAGDLDGLSPAVEEMGAACAATGN